MESGAPFAIVARARLVEDERGRQILRHLYAQAREAFGIAGHHRRHLTLQVERLARGDEEHRARVRLVEPQVRKHVEQRREHAAEQALVHELEPHPLDEDAAGREAVAHLHEEVARIEMGGARGPGVGGLRHDRAVAEVGERQRAARVVQQHAQPRVGERVEVASVRHGAVRVDHLRLELDHVDAFEALRHLLQRHAAAEADHEEIARLRRGEGREHGEPARGRAVARRRAAPLDGGFRQAVVAEAPAFDLFGQQHGRGAADGVEDDPRGIHLVARGPLVRVEAEGRSADARARASPVAGTTAPTAAAPASANRGRATGRTASAASAAANRFKQAVATSVRSKPSAGITTKPAASEPTIAPSVFQA